MKKLRYILYIKCLWHKLIRQQLRILHDALVETHFNYAIVACKTAIKRYVTKLENNQKRFLKLINQKSQAYSSNEVYAEISIVDRRQLYFLSAMTRQYKYGNNFISLSQHETYRRYIFRPET